MPNLSQIIANDPQLSAEPLAAKLAYLFKADIFLTDSDEPYIGVLAWQYLRDHVPHLHVMGARILKFLARLQHLLGEDMGTHANHVRRVCRVIGKVVRDTSLNAICELWVTRHLLAAMSRSGISSRIAEQRVIDPRALGLAAPRALETDLNFLSARGLLHRVGGAFELGDADTSLAVFERCGEIARGFNLDALWADLFLGAGVDNDLLEVVLLLGYSCPTPAPPRSSARCMFSAAELEASYRAFDLALGLDISGLARGMEAGIQVTPSMISERYPGCVAGALKIMRAVGWIESQLHGDIITPLGAYTIHHLPRVAAEYVGWRRWLEDRDSAYRRGRVMMPVRAEIFDDVASRRALDQFAEFDRDTHRAIDHLLVDPVLARAIPARVHHVGGEPAGEDAPQRPRVLAVSLFEDTPASFYDLGDDVSDLVVRQRMLEDPAGWASSVHEEVGEDREIALVLGAGLWPVALQDVKKLEAILATFCRRGWSLVVVFPVDVSLDTLASASWSTRALTDVYFDTAIIHAAGLEQSSPHAWQQVCERAGYVLIDEFTSTHYEPLPFGEVDRESVPRQRSAVMIPKHRRTSLDFRAMSRAVSPGEVTRRLAEDAPQAQVSRSRAGRTWIMLDADDSEAW